MAAKKPASGRPPRRGSGSRPSRPGRPDRNAPKGRSGPRPPRSGPKQPARRTRPDPNGQRSPKRTPGSPPLTTGGMILPAWIQDAVNRTTSPQRAPAALKAVAEAAAAYLQGDYRRALGRARDAKAQSARVAEIRELLGLAAYRCGEWETALRELRTFRRLAGDTSHMAIEMDALRALDRPGEVTKTWNLFRKLGGTREALNEGRVVYASHLLDRGDAKAAWDAVKPQRITADAPDDELRRWYVAARAANVLGDKGTATKLMGAITKADPAFPGIDRLSSEIAT